jgi:hypothetical protein
MPEESARNTTKFPLLDPLRAEAEFLDKIQTKILRVFLLFTVTYLYSYAVRFLFLKTHATSYIFLQTHTPLMYSIVQVLYTVKEKGGLFDRRPYPLLYGLGNPYRNLKSENSQDYAQKPEQNCTFMNSASGKESLEL